MAKPVTNRLRDGETGPEKQCTRCWEWWPADNEFFWADPAGQGGLFFCCKACYHRTDKRPGRRGLVPFLPYGAGGGGAALVELGAIVQSWATASPRPA